ncbi:hypothetical protein K1719_046603 [Acacia pycnantha]|nr:hypothetical protein K1719_046603 [Acacia pycnantha]
MIIPILAVASVNFSIIKEELKELERLNQSLPGSHEQSKTLHTAESVKELCSHIDADVALALKKAKLVKDGNFGGGYLAVSTFEGARLALGME